MDFLRIILASLFSILTLFLLTKLMGYRQISQMTMFDYCNGISIGSIAAEMAINLENDVWYPFTAMVIYTIVIILLAKITNTSIRARRWITGRPLLLLNQDELIRKNFKKANLDLGEFMMQARNAGYFNLSELQCAVLEANGKISFLPKSENRPLTAQDVELKLEPEYPLAPLVMDGVLLTGNLKQTGREEVWLTRQLHALGYEKIREIFLAFCDEAGTLHVYPRKVEQTPKDFLE